MLPRELDDIDTELGGWDDDGEYSFDDEGADAGAEQTFDDEPVGEGDDDAAGGIRDASRDPRVQEVVGDVSERLITEIKKTFDFYHAQSMRERFDAIFLAGGGAHLKDLDLSLREQTGLAISVAEEPLHCVALGTGRALEHLDRLGHVMKISA